jgi:hypothetical protein
MIRLHITAEGKTELNFARKVLAPHLAGHNVFADERCVLTGKNKRADQEYRGGVAELWEGQKGYFGLVERRSWKRMSLYHYVRFICAAR